MTDARQLQGARIFQRIAAALVRPLRGDGPVGFLRDRWLLAALAAGVLLGIQGLGWGRYDCLNLDRMAFQNVMAKDRAPFEPESYLKPPLYTYLNLFAARWPAEFVAKQIPGLAKTDRQQAALRLRVLLARGLNVLLFAATVAMVFRVVDLAFGRESARAAAWILATSAGFVPYQVFLTTDLALVFFMMAGFAASVGILRNPTIGVSILAGLLAGAAAAVKYNGLAVAICLPLAHLLACRGNPIVACLRRPAAWLCGLAVPVGFLLGNPYSVLRFSKFRDDFLYNYEVTPVYSGATSGTGYEEFFRRMPEIFGVPGIVLVALGVVVGLVAVLRGLRQPWGLGVKIWILSGAVFLLYFWKIGGFPRMETRFVLPAAPFLLLLGAAGFSLLLRPRFVAFPVLGAVIAYNIACGWWVGELFRADPRMRALALAERDFGPSDSVETSDSLPQFKYLPGRQLTVFKIPHGIQRKASFEKVFQDDPGMLDRVERFEVRADLAWFDPSSRLQRDPGWIAWCDIDLEPPTRPVFEELLRVSPGYEVVFDEVSPCLPWWVYPARTEFLRNRTVVWRKSG